MRQLHETAVRHQLAAKGDDEGLAAETVDVRRGFGNLLLANAEKRGRKAGFRKLFVLTTRTEHWFEERGFVDSSP
ncbi:MAG TPA: hypothetical protein VF501_00965, partial [Thiobacillus sp.]